MKRSPSLRRQFLGIVVIGAVLPLAALGFWLSRSAVRSGEALLRSQLESALSREADELTSRWVHRRSDVSLLAENEPLRAALLRGYADSVPRFLTQAFATMPALQSAQVRNADGRVVWTLGDRSTEFGGGTLLDASVARTPVIPLAVSVTGGDGTRIGAVEALVRVSDLIRSPVSAVADSGATFALRDRATGSWLLRSTVPPELLRSTHFSWDGSQWLVVQRAVADPAVDLVLASRLDPIITPFANNARIGAVALAIAAIVVIVVTVIATLRLTGSLSTLALAADAVAQGDLERRIDTNGPDEVARVIRAFNAMTENLRRTLRERSQGEALAAMGELAAVLAHQVRSPLTAMRLDLQRVESRLGTPERDLITRAIRQLDRLERAVAGALQMSKTAAVKFEVVDVLRPLERAVAGVEHEFHTRGATLDVERPTGDELRIRGDDATLEQLFSNVLLNAAQAVRDGDTARVTARRMNGFVQVLVEDTGVGMNESTLSRVFEPYYSTKTDGTGIGLAVAKRIISAHDGEVDIASVEGRGTRVAMSFASDPLA